MAREREPGASPAPRLSFLGGFRRSVVVKLIVTFLCVFVPLYVLGIVMYRQSIEILRQEVAVSMEARARFFMGYLEREVGHARELENGLLNDDDLNRLASIPGSLDVVSRFQALIRLQRRLYALATSSQLVGDARVHLRELGRTLYVRGIDPLAPEDLRRLSRGEDLTPSGLAFTDQSIVLRLAYPFQEVLDVQDPLFVVEIDLSLDSLSQAMERLRGAEGGGFVLVSRSGRRVLAGDAPEASHEAAVELASASVAESARSFDVSGQKCLAVAVPSESLDMSLVYYRPERELFARLRGSNAWLLLFSILSLGLIALYCTSVYKMIYEPIHDLVAAFRMLEAGDFDVRIEHRGDREFGYLFGAFDHMTARLKELIDQSYRQTILVQKAELKQLQSQINPHFLYNTFFILYSIARAEGAESVAELTQRLGTYYQFVTRSTDDEVPLAREVEHARVYTDIQELRHGARIRVGFGGLPPECADLPVPRLILQPLIENAIEHGLRNVPTGATLDVGFRAAPEGVDITVEDNGTGMTEEACASLVARIEGAADDSRHTALANIHRRLKLKFGSLSGLSIERREGGGIRATIHIARTGSLGGSVACTAS